MEKTSQSATKPLSIQTVNARINPLFKRISQSATKPLSIQMPKINLGLLATIRTKFVDES
jgi:hypothetical protein